MHEEIYPNFVERLRTQALHSKMGDPQHEDTVVGPLIDSQEAIRIKKWLDEAIDEGAEVLTGRTLDGSMMPSTVPVYTRPHMKIIAQEVFGPVVLIIPYRDFREAVDMVNDTMYGIQAGVYTHDLDMAWYAIKNIHAGRRRAC